jgi:hypothetical protein
MDLSRMMMLVSRRKKAISLASPGLPKTEATRRGAWWRAERRCGGGLALLMDVGGGVVSMEPPPFFEIG